MVPPKKLGRVILTLLKWAQDNEHYTRICAFSCVFETEHDTELFFSYIKPRHPRIHFTMDKEVDHKLEFLGVSIHNDARSTS